MEKQQQGAEIEIQKLPNGENLPGKEAADGRENKDGAANKSGAAQTIVLQMEENHPEESIDLLNVIGHMRRQRKAFFYLLVMAVCLGVLAAALIMGARGVLGTGGYASAVITFRFDGIDEGLDPSGGLFDVNKVKSTKVVDAALAELGREDVDIEAVRANLKIEGVIPDSVKQKIAVINTVSEDAAEYYTNIENLAYFPSRYTVKLYRCKGMSGNETRELLDAILSAYREYFMDSYADTTVLGSVAEVLDIETYDYLQASDVLSNEISTMQEYVDAKAEEAPDFRANSTGLSFQDLSVSIQAVKRLDLNNFVSFVQSNQLTKDAGTQIDYYNYQIKQYDMEIQELQNQLSTVERMITAYEKDPVIVMSNQESVTEVEQKDEYYNNLLSKKLTLNEKLAGLNTELNKAFEMVAALNKGELKAAAEDYEYADSLLSGLTETVSTWSALVQKTTEEYYERELYASAYRISIPAQYTAVGGLSELLKMMLACGGAGALLVIMLWGFAGLYAEVMGMRKAAQKQK